MNDIFVYGTLLNDEVLSAVINRSLAKCVAYLPDHKRVTVRGATYPAITMEVGSKVEGALIKGLDDSDLDRLDQYEGEYYERKPVTVYLSDDVPHHCMTYVFKPIYFELLSSDAWCNEKFRKQDLREFLKGIS